MAFILMIATVIFGEDSQSVQATDDYNSMWGLVVGILWVLVLLVTSAIMIYTWFIQPLIIQRKLNKILAILKDMRDKKPTGLHPE